MEHRITHSVYNHVNYECYIEIHIHTLLMIKKWKLIIIIIKKWLDLYTFVTSFSNWAQKSMLLLHLFKFILLAIFGTLGKKGGSHNNNNNNQKKRTHRQDFRCCYTHSISIFCFHLEILTSLSNKQQMFMQCEMICKWLSSIVSHLYSVLFYKHSCQA